MGIQTYIIELKVDTSDDGHEAMTALVIQSTRDLFSSAALLSPNKQPMVSCRADDAFYDSREIELIATDNDG